MIIGATKESFPGETRIPVTPATISKLIKKGAQVLVESGLGHNLFLNDKDFTAAGATVADPAQILGTADVNLRVRKPTVEEISRLKSGSLFISFLDPFKEKDLLAAFSKRNVSAISLEMIPRTTLAQKMDALSSQANLAGYAAVVIAAERLKKILPMMMTPAGTISPSRVFVIGAGVAGLQAIATAKRLGARVEAFDTRPVVKEQVESLGAKFFQVDLGETGQTKDGYARQLSAEQLAKQREAMAKACGLSDIVITTAQIFGKKAPVIITRDMVTRMRPGSVIVDLAVETGGNVEGSEAGQEVEINGVKVIGLVNLPGRVAVNASDMLAANFANLLEHFWDKDAKQLKLNLDDEILKGCLVTHQGKILKDF